MLGRAPNELPGYGGPGEVHPSDRAAITLADCTLGVVGLGGIGAETARRGLAFGMRVLGVDPRGSRGADRRRRCGGRSGSTKCSEQSDFVVIAAPHTPETYKLFNRERMRRMKRTAYLINVGRGVIVDLADLTAALQAGEIAGAGLDVFETEPLPPEHPLWRMENVIITPHTAAASPRVAERHLETLLDNLRRFVARPAAAQRGGQAGAGAELPPAVPVGRVMRCWRPLLPAVALPGPPAGEASRPPRRRWACASRRAATG